LNSSGDWLWSLAVATKPIRIDAHCHYSPSSYVELLQAEAKRDPVMAGSNRHRLQNLRQEDAPLLKLDNRINEMDDASVDVAVLALPPPGINFGVEKSRPASARLVNDALVEAANEYPGRFAVVANLPFPDVEASLTELDRISKNSVVRGISLFAPGSAWMPDDVVLTPVFTRISELGLPMVMHPSHEQVPEHWKDWKISRALGPMVSSTVCASRILLSGMLDRVPDLELIMPHLGGTLLFLIGRYGDVAGQGAAERPIIEYLRSQFYFDTCSFHEPALRCAVDTVGVERLVMGTDSPFRGPAQRMVSHIEEAFADGESRHLVLGETARKWFDVTENVGRRTADDAV
jgi:predicted TIM-barrel fold metal-dependent hydrolase